MTSASAERLPRQPHNDCPRRRRATFAVLLALAGPMALFSLVGAARAQQSDSVVPPAAMVGAMLPVDEAFALYAASSGLAQVEGARLVLKSTRSAEVRDYALRIVRDHTSAGEQLARIVRPHGLKLPPAPTGRHADMVTKLSGVAPVDIESAFLLRFGVDAHKETIALFERHAAEGKEPALTRYAREMVGMLRDHMTAAHALIHAAGATR